MSTKATKAKVFEFDPVFAASSDMSTTPMRRNRASTITRTDRFANIEEGIVPWAGASPHGKYSSNINLRDAILLCQKAYYNIGIFRTTIDLMTEFSCSKIKLRGGNAQSRKFFTKWMEKIKINKLQDQFYREYYRSGNIFLYRLSGDIGRESMMKLDQAIASSKIPLRYLFLNPADIEILGTSNFSDGQFYKILNSYELQVLLDPKTEQDKRIAAQIPELETLRKTKATAMVIKLLLNSEKIRSIFYKKQDYEPFSIPMGFPVLDDLNYKAELKKIDMAIARTCQIATLLITTGSEDAGPPSPKTLEKYKKIFSNESVARVLVSDYTTQGTWLVPPVADLLDPVKYEIVDRDIRFGLNNILFGEDKFANGETKKEVFLSRLHHSQEVFLDEFLVPEMEIVGRALNFKDIPTPFYSRNRLEKDVAHDRNIVRLFELGALTPHETFDALEDGDLPDYETSLEHQEEFKKLKDKKLFHPILNAGKPEQKTTDGGGRPTGSKAPQTTKKISPIGTKASYMFDASEVKRLVALEDKLREKVASSIKAKFKVKKLSEIHNQIVSDIKDVIVGSETPDKWESSVNDYIANPQYKNNLLPQIDEIAEEFGVEYSIAALLYHSK